MFLLQHLYHVHREVTDQITVGTKILSFTSDRLTFKDSFWGKFGAILCKPTTQVVTTPAHLFQLVSNPAYHIHTVRICNPIALEVVYLDPRDNKADNGRINLFVAAFTTCHARLKLYEYLDHLKEQVLYFDTDSVIYSHLPGQPDIPTGDYLGEMTDELEGDDHIVDFSSGAPKNYGYKTRHGKVERKVRGFTLNVRGSRQLNYDVLRQSVLDELTHPLDHRRDVPVVNPHFFTRHPATKQLKVAPRTKQHGLVFDKRVVDPNNFRSFPYGYTSSLARDDLDMLDVDALLALWEG